MAKAKLTLKQEADMLSAVNQIKELEAAGSTAVHFRRHTSPSMTSTVWLQRASGSPFREVRR